MKGESTRTLLHLALFFFVALVVNLTTAYRVQAQSIDQFFQLSFSIIGPSQTEVTGSQIFTVKVTGAAITKQNLPIAPSEARITGQIVAQNNSTGAEAILNPSYVVTIKPFPSKQGDTYSIDQIVNLQFPPDSLSGNYTVIGRLLEAKVFGVPFIGEMDVSSFLPKTQNIGVVNYLASATVAPTATPVLTPKPTPTATPTVAPTATPVLTPKPIPIPLQPSKALIVLITGIVAVLAIISGVVIYQKRKHSK